MGFVPFSYEIQPNDQFRYIVLVFHSTCHAGVAEGVKLFLQFRDQSNIHKDGFLKQRMRTLGFRITVYLVTSIYFGIFFKDFY